MLTSYVKDAQVFWSFSGCAFWFPELNMELLLKKTCCNEALIQRAEALDDDKLKEKEALTTQAVEWRGWLVSEEGGGSFWTVIFPGVCTWRFAPEVFRIHVQRPQESKIIKLLQNYGPCVFWWLADGEIPFGRSLLWADTWFKIFWRLGRYISSSLASQRDRSTERATHLESKPNRHPAKKCWWFSGVLRTDTRKSAESGSWFSLKMPEQCPS